MVAKLPFQGLVKVVPQLGLKAKVPVTRFRLVVLCLEGYHGHRVQAEGVFRPGKVVIAPPVPTVVAGAIAKPGHPRHLARQLQVPAVRGIHFLVAGSFRVAYRRVVVAGKADPPAAHVGANGPPVQARLGKIVIKDVDSHQHIRRHHGAHGHANVAGGLLVTALQAQLRHDGEVFAIIRPEGGVCLHQGGPVSVAGAPGQVEAADYAGTAQLLLNPMQSRVYCGLGGIGANAGDDVVGFRARLHHRRHPCHALLRGKAVPLPQQQPAQVANRARTSLIGAGQGNVRQGAVGDGASASGASANGASAGGKNTNGGTAAGRQRERAVNVQRRRRRWSRGNSIGAIHGRHGGRAGADATVQGQPARQDHQDPCERPYSPFTYQPHNTSL